MSGRRYDRLNLYRRFSWYTEDLCVLFTRLLFISDPWKDDPASAWSGTRLVQPHTIANTLIRFCWWFFAFCHESNTILKDMVCVCTLLSTIPSKSKVGCIHNACVAKLRKEMALVRINPGLHFSCPNESHGFFWIYNLAPPFASWSTMTMYIFYCWFNLSQKKKRCACNSWIHQGQLSWSLLMPMPVFGLSFSHTALLWSVRDDNLVVSSPREAVCFTRT